MARAIAVRGLTYALVWWALAEGRPEGAWAGLVAGALATAASLALLPPGRGRLRPAAVAAFAAYFLAQSVKGGMQVAAMALRPRTDLAPAVLALPLALPDGPARVLLVNTLNLLPGTVCLAIEGDILRLHVLDARQPVEAGVRDAEAHIARLLGVAA